MRAIGGNRNPAAAEGFGAPDAPGVAEASGAPGAPGAAEAWGAGAGESFVCGIDFGGTKIAVATARPDGTVLAGERLETDAREGAEQAVRRAIHAARDLVARTAADTGGHCAAVGAVSPGIVLPDRVLLAPNVPGWQDLALATTLAEGFDLDPERVAVGNDGKAAALAESRWGALRGADPAILLTLGTGIAAAIVLGGRVLAGANGAAGEIGYLLRDRADIGFGAGRAPLEEYAAGSGLGRRGGELLGRELDAAALFTDPDPRVRALVDEALDELALHVANLAITIDAERIAITGGLMRSAPRVLAALRARIRTAVPFPPVVVPARFLQDASLRGALSLAAESPRVRTAAAGATSNVGRP
ncbi:glucokinase [Embleya scabrispora]|uniref:Glucokinase n=1 Tax=Embleya scabrispora TaxID=159449 RepID=A0A1T3NPT5_9ACTN|nr:ROK family protein [Embleya scabrispora]OPC78720.1 glucokinase [Embleya scabrispora]